MGQFASHPIEERSSDLPYSPDPLMEAHHQSPTARPVIARTAVPRRRVKKKPYRIPIKTVSSLFSSSLPTYLSPSVPTHLRKLFLLNGGLATSQRKASVYIVSGPNDIMIPSLYMDYVVLYDCTWIEESFLRGKMVELQGWAIWPWQYAGPAEYIPMELFDGLPEAATFKQEMSEVDPNNQSQGQQKESFVTSLRQPEATSLPRYFRIQSQRGVQTFVDPPDHRQSPFFHWNSAACQDAEPTSYQPRKTDRFERFSPYKTPRRIDSGRGLAILAERAGGLTFSPPKQFVTTPLIRRGQSGVPRFTPVATTAQDLPAFAFPQLDETRKGHESLTAFKFPRRPLRAISPNDAGSLGLTRAPAGVRLVSLLKDQDSLRAWSPA